MKAKKHAEHRDYEIRYWVDSRKSKPISRGFPKTEMGQYGKSNGAAGAVRAITQGFASKVQCVHRPTDAILWTATGEGVPGTHMRSVRVVRGEGKPV